MSTEFHYPDRDDGIADLKIFSSMNCNENRTLYLCEAWPEGAQKEHWIIHHNLKTAAAVKDTVLNVAAMGLNGTVYIPK